MCLFLQVRPPAQRSTDCDCIFLALCLTLYRPLRDMRARRTRQALLAGSLQVSLLFRVAGIETVEFGTDYEELQFRLNLLTSLVAEKPSRVDGDTLSVRALSKLAPCALPDPAAIALALAFSCTLCSYPLTRPNLTPQGGHATGTGTQRPHGRAALSHEGK